MQDFSVNIGYKYAGREGTTLSRICTYIFSSFTGDCECLLLYNNNGQSILHLF